MSYVSQLAKAQKLPKVFREFYEYLLIKQGGAEVSPDDLPVFYALKEDGWIVNVRFRSDLAGTREGTYVEYDLTPEGWAE